MNDDVHRSEDRSEDRSDDKQRLHLRVLNHCPQKESNTPDNK